MVAEFDRNSHIGRMAVPVSKLLADLQKLGVVFTTSNVLANVCFTKGDKTIFMSQHSFYRYSGMMQITRTKKDSAGKETEFTEVFPVSDTQWLQLFIKPIVLKLLEEA